ncbi:hypothetical protein [Tuberibacillus sp. Marseille-P3662]|uniref:hypothetical protein n=1 Tax=Tuberibacillus sp. Marseille-P3662 TaxID=1965358 RepID=UPI000A1C9EF9|nr:hypothetical protein [Tuberibacillus sp. Marseille-P3662]
MKKIIFSILAVVALLVWQGWSIYDDARGYQNKQINAAKETLKNRADVKTIKNIHPYYGSKTYMIANVKLKKGSEAYIWLPQADDGTVVVKSAEEGVTADQVAETVRKTEGVKSVVDVTLGMFNGIPAWEIKYITENDQYVFGYYAFANGDYMNNIKIS